MTNTLELRNHLDQLHTTELGIVDLVEIKNKSGSKKH